MDPERVDFSLVDADDDTAEQRPAGDLTAPHEDSLSCAQDARTARAPAQARPAAGGRPAPAGPRPAVSVLADRLAAALVHHEPGWRLPRHSALARRYSICTAQIDLAVDELVSRHLVRRLADGQLYRASPAEYLIGLEGVPGLVSSVDAMGGEFICRSRQVSWRLPPEDISWALRLNGGEPVCVLRYMWTAGGEPAAFCTTFLPGDIAGRPAASSSEPLPSALSLVQLSGIDGDPTTITGVPAALHIELQA